MDEVLGIIKNKKFQFNKALGQNFITDKFILQAIVKDAGITKDDVVVEIGTGAGTLTSALADVAKKVVSFEVDKNLEPVINEVIKDKQNVQVIFADMLKTTDEKFREWVPETFKIVANLPYYITSPMIMRFVESDLPIRSMTVMVQKEVADRFTANPGTPEYGAITVALNAVSNVTMTRFISRRVFYPIPNVDSAIVRMDIEKAKYDIHDMLTFKKLVKAIFTMRRKTIANNLSYAFNISKQDISSLLNSINKNSNIRGENLTIEDMVTLSNEIFSFINK